mmetsp:Transcript_49658/g.116715  ORF Transcript_49658/g.116715 Transcript_49658/m.116715 type:complete len:207 (-) Transcript_49658:430-1050(-)
MKANLKQVTSNGQILQESRVPLELDYLQVDIDCNDCQLLQTILEAGYRPKVVMLQVSPYFPWPILFNVYGADVDRDYSLIHLCSLAYAQQLFHMWGYVLFEGISLSHDAIFVRRDIAPVLDKYWQRTNVWEFSDSLLESVWHRSVQSWPEDWAAKMRKAVSSDASESGPSLAEYLEDLATRYRPIHSPPPLISRSPHTHSCEHNNR